MFLAALNEAQKQSFLVLATRLTVADGEDSADELEALDTLKAEMNIAGDADMHNVLGDIDVTAFDTHRTRVIAALELLVLTYADEYVHEAEVAAVRQICEAMGFNEEWLAAMGDWASRYADLANQPQDEDWRANYDAMIEHAEAMMDVA